MSVIVSINYYGGKIKFLLVQGTGFLKSISINSWFQGECSEIFPAAHNKYIAKLLNQVVWTTHVTGDMFLCCVYGQVCKRFACISMLET